MTLRLVLDENISWRLKKLIPQWDILPSNEIKLAGRLTDFLIWQFAKSNNFTILTFDEDFSALQNLFAFPPKIIWLRTGNAATRDIASVLIRHEQELIKFLNDEELGVYEIYIL